MFHHQMIVGVSPLQGTPPPSSTHIVADIVLIVSGLKKRKPLIYQHQKKGGGSFHLIGTFASLDKARKMIHFSNLSEDPQAINTISYQHLILMRGEMEHIPPDQLLANIHSLLEADQVQKKIGTIGSNHPLLSHPPHTISKQKKGKKAISTYPGKGVKNVPIATSLTTDRSLLALID